MRSIRDLLLFLLTILILLAFIGMFVVVHQFDQLLQSTDHAAALLPFVGLTRAASGR